MRCIWYIRLSIKGLFTKKVFLVNENIVHLVDDIFWNCGFKTESQGEQVMIDIIAFYRIFGYYYTYCHWLQVRADLGIADHIWKDKRIAIAKRVDDLGDQFRPVMRAGWLAYITRNYPKDAASAGPVLREGELVVADDDVWFLSDPASCIVWAIKSRPSRNSVLLNNRNNR